MQTGYCSCSRQDYQLIHGRPALGAAGLTADKNHQFKFCSLSQRNQITGTVGGEG